MKRPRLAILASLFLASSASAQTSWNVNANGSWQNPANWNPAIVPDYYSEIATLGNIITANRTVTLNGPVSLNSLIFNVSGTSAYTLDSSAAGNTLSLYGYIVNTNVTGTAPTQINLAANAAGNLIAEGSLNFSNTSANGATLTFGPTTTIVSNNTSYGLSLNNYQSSSNVINVNGNIGAVGKTFSSLSIGGLNPGGQAGTVVLRGDNTNIGGFTSVYYGSNLVLDYTASTTNKVDPTKSFISGYNGTLTLQGNAAATTQVVSSFYSNLGTLTVNVNNGAGGFTFNTGEIILGQGVVNFSSLPTVGSIKVLNPNTNGILGNFINGFNGKVVIGGTNWGAKSGTDLVAYNSYSVNTFAAGQNSDITSNQSPAAFTTNSLRFNTPNTTLTLTGTNTISSGGILNTPNVGATTTLITGGNLTTPGGTDLSILQFNTAGPLSIASSITANTLNKYGPGELILGGSVANTLTNLYQLTGTLTLNKTSGVNAVTSNLQIVGGTANISAGNLSSNTNLFVGGTGALNLLGSQSIRTFRHDAGTLNSTSPNFQLTLPGAVAYVELNAPTYQFNGNAFTFSNSSGGSVNFLINASGFTQLTSTNSSTTPVFNFGGFSRSSFVVAGFTATLNGPHISNGGFIKDGDGAIIMNGAETYTGTTEVRRGQLFVNNSFASPIQVQATTSFSALLGGTGTISQPVTLAGSNVFLSPGLVNAYYGSNGLGSAGTLSMSSLNASTASGYFYVDLFGNTPGVSYDSVSVAGSAILGTGLRLFIYDESYLPAVNTTFLLMTRGAGSSGLLINDNNGMLLNEGDIFGISLHPDYHFQITYQGGDGNDIAITFVGVPEPTTWALIGLSACGTGFGWYRWRQRQTHALDAEVQTECLEG